jgi:D-sedoheptulose 7-phosphate isomerase
MLTGRRDTHAPSRPRLEAFIAEGLRARGTVIREFFEREALRLTAGSADLAERFERGGRLFAFGRGPYATDAAHLSVEFVHPVIVGKRALGAVDASSAPAAMLAQLGTPDDIAIGLGPPAGDPETTAVLALARDRGLLTFALPGEPASAAYAFAAPSGDAHVHQELFELLGHALYETVHVFLEHRSHVTDAGAASFLYPFLGGTANAPLDRPGIAASIVAKAADGEALRERVAHTQSAAIAAAAATIAERLQRGGRILTFGNGGSATDATDFALDCLSPEEGFHPIPALSLSAEPAILTAIGNDVGMDLVFVRQIIAQSRPSDVAFAFSTSGGSKNVVAALVEARARGLATVALLGYDGGHIARRGLADHTIVVESDYVPRIQEVQGAIYHVLRAALELVRDGA